MPLSEGAQRDTQKYCESDSSRSILLYVCEYILRALRIIYCVYAVYYMLCYAVNMCAAGIHSAVYTSAKVIHSAVYAGTQSICTAVYHTRRLYTAQYYISNHNDQPYAQSYHAHHDTHHIQQQQPRQMRDDQSSQ